MTKFEELSSYKYLYSSHGHTMTFLDFIFLECFERENYTKEDIVKWMSKYKNLKINSPCIWVADYDIVMKKYSGGAEDCESVNVCDGFLIEETDDGDEGFLFIYNEAVK